MSKEKVENFKLSKEQRDFTKAYKRVLKAHKALGMNLTRQLSEADLIRQQLGEVEQTLQVLAEQAPNPNVPRLSGQLTEE